MTLLIQTLRRQLLSSGNKYEKKKKKKKEFGPDPTTWFERATYVSTSDGS